MNIRRSHKDRLLRAAFVLISVALSTVLSYIAYYFDLPIFLDTVGTVVAAFIGGCISCYIDCSYDRSRADVIFQF